MPNKIISVIIPYYKETEKVIFPILSSLNNQVGIDFEQIEIIMVNDGVYNVLSESYLNIFYNLDIKCVFMDENKGPGVARQVGIDNATGAYVMFCDADDTLHNVAVLGAFLQEINANKPDIITTPWLEELYDIETKSYIYINHEDEATWMHGKVFKRSFLNDNNIRFHEDLRVHEDSYFLSLAFAATNNIRKVLFTSYVWKFVPNSITRRDNASYTYNSAPEFNRAIGLSFKELEEKGYSGMAYKVVQFIMYNYFILHQNNWLIPEHEAYLKQAEETFRDTIKPYMYYYFDASPEFITIVYNQERNKSFNNCIETELLNDWINRIQVA